ncbi:glycosyltransferase [Fulvivirga lutimaris]|uniref:glycosyltransferase n=1 Tax=Fulvivirga lutimaris TaxID=1819566 RepID=UPI0012BD38F1|nr:glycosyltransferase [Fulvivirga lutimaris]MTI41537.1 glycosyltransferase [Fulvivirga lutimaris]
MFYSVIIPVYNRPQEIDELLESLTYQTYKNFEVLIVEDGSSDKCDHIIPKYQEQLKITYYFKPNTGQGFSRNYGFDQAKGDYFIVFDSDCIIPKHYFQAVEDYLNDNPVGAYGGPDKAHESFTPMQKAISYSMTSPFTTGGIRGNKKHYGTFHPRSFNMGISKEVYAKVGGYKITRMGEDLEFSMRMIKAGYQTALIEDAFVYHKRRTSLSQFYKQLHFFGRARINVGRFYPEEVKLLHWFPALFTLGFLSLPLLYFIFWPLAAMGLGVYLLFLAVNFSSSLAKNKSLKVAIISMATSFTQLYAYGIGFLTEGWRKLLKG